MPGDHALLSPSGAKRWLTCNPSARLESTLPEKSSVYADEGTLAHSIAEDETLLHAGQISKINFKKRMLAHKKSPYYSKELVGYSKDFVSFCFDQLNDLQDDDPDSFFLIESRLDLSDFAPESFGRVDFAAIGGTDLFVTDLKYGKGVLVEAEHNEQLMLYAIGMLVRYDGIFPIKDVYLTIYQPRLDNISTWRISVDELMAWATDIVKPAAAIAFKGEGSFVPGDHCGFCRAKALCRAFKDYCSEPLDEEFRDPDMLTDDEITLVVERMSLIRSWLNGVGEYALEKAIKGKKWPDLKLVRGKSNRQYVNEDGLVDKLLEMDISEEEIYDSKIIGIGKMEKLLGVNFNEITKGFVIKPDGAPTLVPLSDKRPELGSVESARQAFKDFN